MARVHVPSSFGPHANARAMLVRIAGGHAPYHLHLRLLCYANMWSHHHAPALCSTDIGVRMLAFPSRHPVAATFPRLGWTEDVGMLWDTRNGQGQISAVSAENPRNQEGGIVYCPRAPDSRGSIDSRGARSTREARAHDVAHVEAVLVV